jgi:hypothetical protein
MTVRLDDSLFLHVLQYLVHISLLSQQESMMGLINQIIASVDAMVNSACLPTVVTLRCENVLELGDEYLQLLDLSGDQVQPHARYHTLQLLQSS